MKIALCVAATLLALSLTACNGGDNPTPAPLPTSTPTTTTSPTNAPTLPPEVVGPDPTSAEAWTRHYFDVLNFAIATGSTDQLSRLGSPGCVSCAAFVGKIKSIYRAGGSVQSHGWRITRALTTVGPDNTMAVELRVTLTKETVIMKAGQKPAVHGAANHQMTATVHWQSGRWRMQTLDLVR
jgi:hypothetical protein